MDAEIIRDAIRHAGGTMRVAHELGVTPGTVSHWIRRQRVPADRTLALERLCEAKVTRYDLRPDVFGAR